MMGTPLQVLLEHLAAFSNGDNGRLAAALSLPFVHLWPDGTVWSYDRPDEVDIAKQYEKAGIDAATYGRTELDEARLILDWEELKAFYVRFTRYSADGDIAVRAEAIWVVTRGDAGWKLKLRIGAKGVAA